MGFGSLGFGSLGFRVYDLMLRVQGSGFGKSFLSGLFRLQGFRVWRSASQTSGTQIHGSKGMQGRRVQSSKAFALFRPFGVWGFNELPKKKRMTSGDVSTGPRPDQIPRH